MNFVNDIIHSLINHLWPYDYTCVHVITITRTTLRIVDGMAYGHMGENRYLRTSYNVIHRNYVISTRAIGLYIAL